MAATIKGSLIALSACLDDAVRGRLLTANPARGVTVRRVALSPLVVVQLGRQRTNMDGLRRAARSA